MSEQEAVCELESELLKPLGERDVPRINRLFRQMKPLGERDVPDINRLFRQTFKVKCLFATFGDGKVKLKLWRNFHS